AARDVDPVVARRGLAGGHQREVRDVAGLDALDRDPVGAGVGGDGGGEDVDALDADVGAGAHGERQVGALCLDGVPGGAGAVGGPEVERAVRVAEPLAGRVQRL